jgi:tetratricopeptide (TPR) repeat protein
MRKLPAVAISIGITALALLAGTDHGVELYHQGKFAAAEAELAKAVEANDDDAVAHRYLGLAQIEQHKVGDAEAHIKRAAELDSNGDSKLALARLAIERKNYDEAESQMDGAEGAERDYVAGLLQLNRQKNSDAAASFERYLSKNPDQAYAHYYAGLAYNGMKRPDKMLSHFELFLKLAPEAPEAKKVRAVVSTGR